MKSRALGRGQGRYIGFVEPPSLEVWRLLRRHGVASTESARRGRDQARAAGGGVALVPRMPRRDRSVPPKLAVSPYAISTGAGIRGGPSKARATVGVGSCRAADGWCPFLDLLLGLLIGSGSLHADQEVILIFDEENDDTLIQSVFFRCHGMVGMRQHSRLEDRSQVLGRHPVLVRFGSKDGQQVENVEEELAVKRRQLCDEVLVLDNGLVLVEVILELWSLGVANGLFRGALEGLSEFFVEVQWDDGLGEVVEVSSKHIRGVVHGVSVPDQTFSISVGRVKNQLQLLDALFRAAQTEDALDAGCCDLQSAPGRDGDGGDTHPSP